MAASWLWYEEREEGLGDRLFSAVINKLNSIAKNPDAFSIKCRPYIKYTKEKSWSRQFSVFHTSRNPTRKY